MCFSVIGNFSENSITEKGAILERSFSMQNSLLKNFTYFFIIIIFLIFFIPCFFFPVFINSNVISFLPSNSGYIWPIPGYTTITSYFGRRISPTAGASSFHKGIDIGAPENTNLIAITSGTITYTGFLGGGGYTITLSPDESTKITYCHVSPNFLVKTGDFVTQGQLIGLVGPMYVDNVPGNQYHDELGRPTNGAMTGTHLHLGVRIGDEYIDPLSFFETGFQSAF